MLLEENILIKIMSDHLNNRDTVINKKYEKNKLKLLATQQQISSICYFQTQEDIFKGDYFKQLYFCANQELLVRGIKDSLNKEKIQYVFVKGVVLKDYYPIPELRSMGDIDLIVHLNDKEKTGQILENQGFHVEQATNEWVCINKNFEVELHHALSYKKDKFEAEYILNDFWTYVSDNELNLNFHFVYLFFHLRRHIIDGGIGLRQLYDIAVLTKKCKLNWKWIEQKLQTCGLYNFACNVLQINKILFEVENPMEEIVIRKETIDYIIEEIFKGGVFGVNNGERENLKKLVSIAYKEKISNKKARFKFITRQILPSFQMMSRIPRYVYIRKNKFFIVFAWMNRMFNILIDPKQRTKFFADLNITDEEIERRKDKINAWGIL